MTTKGHIMFDIDGTLLHTPKMDDQAYADAARDVFGDVVNPDWGSYPNVSDEGIARTLVEKHGEWSDFEKLRNQIKDGFVARVRNGIEKNGVVEVEGALAFFEYLKSLDEVSLSLATGGWKETALLKLYAAGFDLEGIVLATSDDHFERREIMKCAKTKALVPDGVPVTYFGDGPWDQKASASLGYHFVAIGERCDHPYRMSDYLDQTQAFALACAC